jgi:hypothetical protein
MINYTRMLTSMVSNEYNARLELYDTLTRAPIAHASALIAAQSEGNVKALEALYNLRSSATAQLNQARIMEASLLSGGESAAKSNVAALHLLKIATFSALQNTQLYPASLSIGSSTQVVPMTLEEQLTDVQALVSVLEEYVARLDEDIAQVAQSEMVGAELNRVGGLETGVDSTGAAEEKSPDARVADAYTNLFAPGGVLEQPPIDLSATVSDAHEELMTTLEAEIRALEAAITAENAKERELSHRRDLAWTTYETVGNKLQELNLLRSSANTEVRMGNAAMVPLAPQPQDSPFQVIAAITLAGFFLAVILVLLVDSLGVQPFFSRRFERRTA